MQLMYSFGESATRQLENLPDFTSYKKKSRGTPLELWTKKRLEVEKGEGGGEMASLRQGTSSEEEGGTPPLTLSLVYVLPLAPAARIASSGLVLGNE